MEGSASSLLILSFSNAGDEFEDGDEDEAWMTGEGFVRGIREA
jgi:hypothetical protein